MKFLWYKINSETLPSPIHINILLTHYIIFFIIHYYCIYFLISINLILISNKYLLYAANINIPPFKIIKIKLNCKKYKDDNMIIKFFFIISQQCLFININT